MKYRCDACGKDSDERSFRSGFCMNCGATAVVAVEEQEEEIRAKRGSTATITRPGQVESRRLVACKAPILQPVGGLCRGRLHCVSGSPFAGKSTECVRVAVAMDESMAYIVRSSEMDDAETNVVLEDAGAQQEYMAKKVFYVGADTWEEAIDAAERTRAKFWVWDSANAWVEQHEAELLRFAEANKEIAQETDTTIFVIRQWKVADDGKKGRPKGDLTLEHTGALTVNLHAAEIQIPKARAPYKLRINPATNMAQKSYPRILLEAGQTWEGMKVTEWTRKRLAAREKAAAKK